MNTSIPTQRSTPAAQPPLPYREPADLVLDLADLTEFDESVQETELSVQEIQSAWWDEDDEEEIQRYAELGCGD